MRTKQLPELSNQHLEEGKEGFFNPRTAAKALLNNGIFQYK